MTVEVRPAIDDASIHAEIERRFENVATETANAATFATSYGEDGYLIANSDRRTDGVILDALIGEDSDSDLIVKTVNGLLGQQTRGRWNSAQDNAFILIAMNRYFHTFESVTPDMVARAWIGDTYAAEHMWCVKNFRTDPEIDACRASVRQRWGIVETVTKKDGGR